MTPKEIEVRRRKPKEEYGALEIAVKADLDKGDDLQEELAKLIAEVEKAIDGEDAPTPPKKKRGKKKPADEEETEENEESEETDDSETEETEDEESEEQEESQDDEESEDPPPKKGKKVVRKKSAVYDRDNEIHKKLMGEQLTKYDKTWKKTAKGKAAAKKISQKLEGEEFLNDDGKVLPSFITTMRKEYVAASPKAK